MGMCTYLLPRARYQTRSGQSKNSVPKTSSIVSSTSILSLKLSSSSLSSDSCSFSFLISSRTSCSTSFSCSVSCCCCCCCCCWDVYCRLFLQFMHRQLGPQDSPAFLHFHLFVSHLVLQRQPFIRNSTCSSTFFIFSSVSHCTFSCPSSSYHPYCVSDGMITVCYLAFFQYCNTQVQRFH